MFIGDKEVKSVYLGGKEVKSIYLGNKEVWTGGKVIYNSIVEFSSDSFKVKEIIIPADNNYIENLTSIINANVSGSSTKLLFTLKDLAIQKYNFLTLELSYNTTNGKVMASIPNYGTVNLDGKTSLTIGNAEPYTQIVEGAESQTKKEIFALTNGKDFKLKTWLKYTVPTVPGQSLPPTIQVLNPGKCRFAITKITLHN